MKKSKAGRRKPRVSGKGNREKKEPPLYSPQPCCQLLQLPQELRDEIYLWVLGSTRITFGEDYSFKSSLKPTVNKTASNALALLYTCRQIREEIGSLWISWVLFSFQTPESLLDILTKLPNATVKAIRHVRTNGRPVMLSLPQNDVYYRLTWTLKLVPHLRLDTLTVLGGSASNIAGGPAQVDYNTLDGLITHGTGWKQLRFITPNSLILGFQKTERFGKTYLREPQPDAWRSALYQRDGLDSGASVTIYRSKIDKPGSIVNYLERETFQQSAALGDPGEFGAVKDPFLTLPCERDKEVLVVVTRGRHTDILREQSRPPYDPEYDIRALASGMTWSRIRKEYTEGYCSDDEEFLVYRSYGGIGWSHLPAVEDDTYGQNAHEITWSDNMDPDYRASGGHSDDWDEQAALRILQSRITGL